MLKIDHFSFTYPGAAAPALDDLNLHVKHGEFVAVIGANKAGKSSLCHALTGVIPQLFRGDVQGHIRVADKNATDTSVALMSTLIALVMQKPEHQLSGVRFTVKEEIAFSLENQGMPPHEIQRRVEDAMRRTGVSDLADCSPHHLSCGQLQRVALTAALATDTPVLVLDEPTTFLDPRSALETFATLKQLSREGKTVILAEHRLDFIAMYADRVVVMHNGAIALEGPPETVLVSPLLKKTGLDWTRFTKVAHLAMRHGLWDEGESPSTTLTATLNGLRVN